MKLNWRANLRIIVVVSAAAAFFLGCDPGYQLRPIGWSTGADHVWVKKFDDFEIQTKGIGGLIGEWWIDPDLQVFRNTKPIVVQSAELRTANEVFQAKIYDGTAIPPSESGYHFPIEWKFDRERTAPRVLGDHCEIILNLKVGSDARQIKIEYAK
jgi:hypothetical protein